MSVLVVGAIHLAVIVALATGLAAQLMQKPPEELNTEVIKDKPPEQNKVPPPPPPELVKPPPPFVPPPDITVSTETPSTNTITQVTTQHETPKPAITAPASIGRAHSCGASQYPALAQRLNHEGDTGISFTINTDGSVSNVTITKSSGHDELDQAAITCSEHWTYKPALQNGQPVAVPWSTTVRWKLP